VCSVIELNNSLIDNYAIGSEVWLQQALDFAIKISVYRILLKSETLTRSRIHHLEVWNGLQSAV